MNKNTATLPQERKNHMNFIKLSQGILGIITLSIPFMIVYILKTFISLIFSKRFNLKFTLMLDLALYLCIYYFLFKLLSNIKTQKDIEIWTFGILMLVDLYFILIYLEDQRGKKKDKDRLKEKQ